MSAPKGNKNAIGNRGGGRATTYLPEYAALAEKVAILGATDAELATVLDVCETTINKWKLDYVEFREALKNGKLIADANVAHRLYQRALGYSHEAVKFLTVGGKVVREQYTEHYPPDPTAAIFFLKNRRPKDWRDKQEIHLRQIRSPEDLTDQELEALIAARADKSGER